MAKLGSKKRPAIVRVQTEAKAEEMLRICTENDWQVIVGIESPPIGTAPRNISPLLSLMLSPPSRRCPTDGWSRGG